jgi:hypothetical protein
LQELTVDFVMSVCLSVCPSVRMEVLCSHRMDLHEFWYLSIFENISRKLKLHQNRTRITGSLQEDQYTTVIIICSFHLRMKNVSNRICIADQHTHYMFNNFFLNGTKYEIMWMTIWCMCNACWVPKATNTHSEYVILIAFLLHQWLHERAPMHCLSSSLLMFFVAVPLSHKSVNFCNLATSGHFLVVWRAFQSVYNI